MSGGKVEESALGTARGRFIESLPKKAIELRGAIALLSATPNAEGPREDMRRRLHTLYASALVFRNDALAHSVREGIECIDAARDEKRALTAADLDRLSSLVRRLPELREGGPATVSTRPSQAPATAEPAPAEATGKSTGKGSLSPLGSGALRSPSAPPSGRRAPLLQMVIRVLALDHREGLARLRALLPKESFELVLVNSVEEALADARAHAPDVVLADRELAARGDLLRRLRSDPLTDFVPVVLLLARAAAADPVQLRDEGADEIVLRPLDADSLTRTLGRVTGTLLEEGSALMRMGDATLDEVAQRVADEVRRGIVEAADAGRDLKIPLGEGAEVLAAAWAAVARVRAFVAQQSGGRVRFRDPPRRGGPALLALVGGSAELEGSNIEGTLTGRRILVVDDDPAVVWFFAGLLREEGAAVVETGDGREALAAARKERPDVVISDILMPQVDGFALCREFKRDPALSDVPVILISWKEDLLHRMRELSAGASGYLRKEAGTAQILAQVREVLRPRDQLEAQLATGGEVRGNLEGTGVVALLRSSCRVRPNARVTIRDAWNLFECELREGKLVHLTRTASDGTFSRGERALPLLLGASAGRFVVADAGGPIKVTLVGTLDEVLSRGARELGALVDAVSGASLMRVERVTFDDDSYPMVLKQSPGPVRRIVERLYQGEAPSLLLMTGDTTAQVLEAVLVDLARRGAIREARAKDGSDLVQAARAARAELSQAEPPLPKGIAVPIPRPVISLLEPKDVPSVLDPEAAAPVAPASSSSEAGVAPPLASEGRANGTLEDSFELPSLDLDDVPADKNAVGTAPRPAEVLAGPPRHSAVAEEASGANEPPPELVPVKIEPEEPDLRAAEERRSRSTIAAWVLGFVVIFAAAFVGERFFEQRSTTARLRAIGDNSRTGAQAKGKASDGSAAARDVEPNREPTPPEQPGSEPAANIGVHARANVTVAAEDAGFEIRDGIVEPSIVVGATQGLLQIDPVKGESVPVKVEIDGKSAGELPLRIALDQGIHELALIRGDRISYRYVSMRPQRTFRLRSP